MSAARRAISAMGSNTSARTPPFPGPLQPKLDVAIRELGQPFLGNRGARQIPAESLEVGPVAGLDMHIGVELEALGAAHTQVLAPPGLAVLEPTLAVARPLNDPMAGCGRGALQQKLTTGLGRPVVLTGALGPPFQ
jgi:hypothetical protein